MLLFSLIDREPKDLNSSWAERAEQSVFLKCILSHVFWTFRYCNQVLSKEIDECVTLLLQELVSFQEQIYQKDPMRAKAKRRLVMGLREVTKHMKLNKIKCVIISPNCEKIQSKGIDVNFLWAIFFYEAEPSWLLSRSSRRFFPSCLCVGC